MYLFIRVHIFLHTYSWHISCTETRNVMQRISQHPNPKEINVYRNVHRKYPSKKCIKMNNIQTPKVFRATEGSRCNGFGFCSYSAVFFLSFFFFWWIHLSVQISTKVNWPSASSFPMGVVSCRITPQSMSGHVRMKMIYILCDGFALARSQPILTAMGLSLKPQLREYLSWKCGIYHSRCVKSVPRWRLNI